MVGFKHSLVWLSVIGVGLVSFLHVLKRWVGHTKIFTYIYNTTLIHNLNDLLDYFISFRSFYYFDRTSSGLNLSSRPWPPTW